MENTNKLAIHTKAFNLARRFTVQNENDLLQVNNIMKSVSTLDFVTCCVVVSIPHLILSSLHI